MESQEEALCVACRRAVDASCASHGDRFLHVTRAGYRLCAHGHAFVAPLPTVRVLSNANGGNEPLPSPASTPAPLDIEAIRARVNAAADGPWEVERLRNGNQVSYVLDGAVRWRGYVNSLDFAEDEDSAQFVAHARTDVPALIAEIERLRRENGGVS